jgi:DNA-3-methyladenine glycosylase II
MLDFEEALHFFTISDPVLADLMERVMQDTALQLRNPVKAKPDQYVFRLYRSIISQQISTKAASKILERFLQLVGDPHDAQNILQFDIDQLKSIGLSRQKASYIRSIAQLTSDGTVQIEHLDQLRDQQVIDELVKIKGIGQWSAEMFLMFTLARPDVFSVGDLGLLNAAKRLYGLPDLGRSELEAMSQMWSPYRTTAALVLWHSQDNQPTA